MSEKLIFSAYRLPRLSFKGMVKNILSIKGKTKKGFNEKASEYILELQSGLLTVYEVDFQGERQKVHSTRLSIKEQAKLLKNEKYENKYYVYHIMEEVKE